jgi:hypothetical protein
LTGNSAGVNAAPGAFSFAAAVPEPCSTVD